MNQQKLQLDKLEKFREETLFKNLNYSSQEFIINCGEKYLLTFQELRKVTEIAVDFSMWGVSPIEDVWNSFDNDKKEKDSSAKIKLLKKINEYWETIKSEPTDYNQPASKVKSIGRKVKDNLKNNDVFGMCPVASEKTVCCNLMTIDAIQGCTLGCSYCSIQTFYSDGKVAVETNLADKLNELELDPKKNYHIGSGQSSDSLALGNRAGVLDAQVSFARKNPNVILEFKTKSKQIEYFLESDIPSNIFISWSLNPQKIIDREEHFTASLNMRLESARKVANKGILVAFHFHPIVYYDGWEKDYLNVINKVMEKFSPNEVGMISLGTLTFIKPAIKNLRKLGIKSKVLQMPMSDASGKYSYPFKIKKKIFDYVYSNFGLWHEKVFFYFCMEEKKLWQSVMGKCYETNEDFENSLFISLKKKLIRINYLNKD